MIKEAFLNAAISAANTKLAFKPSLFTHATSASNLKKILDAGSLMPLEALAKKAPSVVTNVESGLTSMAKRQDLSAADALKAMRGVKETDKLFLTKDGYMPHYGEHLITKNMAAPSRRKSMNLIPEEYVTADAIKMRDADTAVYVPDEVLEDWLAKYPGVNIKPNSEYVGNRYSRLDGMMALPGKALDNASSMTTPMANKLRRLGLGHESLVGAGLGTAVAATDSESDIRDYAQMAALGAGTSTLLRNAKGLGGFLGNKLDLSGIENASPRDIRRMFGSDAIMAGSEALGVAAKNAPTDIDVLVPFKTQYFYDRAVKDLKSQYPDMVPSPFNKGKIDKGVYTINHNGTDIDIALAKGEKGYAFRDAFLNAKDNLTDAQRQAIITEKERLNNVWFARNLRYKRYKSRLADQMGLRQHYF